MAATDSILEDEVAGTQTLQGGRILLISDMQEGDRLDELGTFEWPKNVVVELSQRSNQHFKWFMFAASEQVLSTTADQLAFVFGISRFQFGEIRLRWDGDDSGKS